VTEQQFKDRTKKLALEVIALVTSLPNGRAAEVIGRQLLRSGTSIGANYRAACRGKSAADVIAKLSIVEEEADETLYWMELLTEAKTVPPARCATLMSETNQILAMTVASIRTLRGQLSNPKSKIQNLKSKILLLMAVAAAVCGCSSGAGKVGGGVAQQDRATQHVTSVVLVRRWTQVIYNLQAPGSSSCSFQQTPVQRQADGSIVQETTFDNCVHEKRTQFRDGHVVIEDQFPEGTSQSVTVGRVQARGSVLTIPVAHAFSNGDAVSYDYVRDTRNTPFNFADDTEQWRGQITFKAQQTEAFTVQRTNAAQGSSKLDTLETALPDGSRFTINVPLKTAAGGFSVPNFTGATAGSYTSGGQRVAFELRGAGADAWNEWTLTAPDGVTGRFALNPDFSGSGQLFRNGQIDSSIAWDRDGKASVTLVGGEATTAGPSAAALAFLAHAWRAMFASGGPGPGVQ
jgi:four helix bundle protein